jgi:hypothetical protein
LDKPTKKRIYTLLLNTLKAIEDMERASAEAINKANKEVKNNSHGTYRDENKAFKASIAVEIHKQYNDDLRRLKMLSHGLSDIINL